MFSAVYSWLWVESVFSHTTPIMSKFVNINHPASLIQHAILPHALTSTVGMVPMISNHVIALNYCYNQFILALIHLEDSKVYN